MKKVTELKTVKDITFRLASIGVKNIKENTFVCRQITYKTGTMNISNIIRMKSIGKAKSVTVSCIELGKL